MSKKKGRATAFWVGLRDLLVVGAAIFMFWNQIQATWYLHRLEHGHGHGHGYG